MKSWATDSEIDLCMDLSHDTPFIIAGVTHSIMSTARHYGACVYNGRDYTYITETDELVRDDVMKRINANRKREAKKKPIAKTENGQKALL